MRIALVSPYAWDRPSPPTEHARVLAGALARRGIEVVVLAPATSGALLREGRSRLRRLAAGDRSAVVPLPGIPLQIAVGYAVELRTAGQTHPLPVAARASISVALAEGSFDVVELLDPDLLGPSASVILRSPAPLVATFSRPPVLAWSRLRSHLGAVRALTPAVAAALGGEAKVAGIAVDPGFRPGSPAAPPMLVLDAGLTDTAMLRALASELAAGGVSVRLLGTKPLRVAQVLASGELARAVAVVRDPGSAAVRAELLAGASLLVAGAGASVSSAAEALAAGVPVVVMAGAPGAELVDHGITGFVAAADQPALAAAYTGRLLSDEGERSAIARAAAASIPDADTVAAASIELYASLSAGGETRSRNRDGSSGDRVLCDFHLHTDHSSDCATSVPELVHRALQLGLGAIAVTDHNSIAGGLEARAYVVEQELPLHVVVGSEVKTTTGEVIGLYLSEDVPRGLTFADTVAAIRAQGAVVYVPHPFDRRHAIPDTDLLARLVDELDVIEVANGRLLRESYNDDALEFAERHALLQGAGSDEHVIEGLGSAVVELPPFDDPESLLAALAQGRIVRRPTSFYQLQALKLVRQTRKRLRAG